MKNLIFAISITVVSCVWFLSATDTNSNSQFETSCIAAKGRFDPGGWILTRDGLRTFQAACEMHNNVPTIAEMTRR